MNRTVQGGGVEQTRCCMEVGVESGEGVTWQGGQRVVLATQIELKKRVNHAHLQDDRFSASLVPATLFHLCGADLFMVKLGITI